MYSVAFAALLMAALAGGAAADPTRSGSSSLVVSVFLLMRTIGPYLRTVRARRRLAVVHGEWPRGLTLLAKAGRI